MKVRAKLSRSKHNGKIVDGDEIGLMYRNGTEVRISAKDVKIGDLGGPTDEEGVTDLRPVIEIEFYK